MSSWKNFFDSKYLFILGLVACFSLYFIFNYNLGVGALSSDVWGYQFLEIQSRYHHWGDVPPSYNQSELYLAFPLFYYLNPGLDSGLWSYHLLSIVVIAATYLISGLVAYKIFRSWWIAGLVGVLVLIPRFIFPTRMGFLDLSSLRGNILAAPFYFLLSYYWIIYGIKSQWQNIGLGVLAGFLIYVYPPVGAITVFFFWLTALVIYRFYKWKPLAVFALVYLVAAAPFWLNHVINPATGMLDQTTGLSAEEILLQSEIIQYKFRGSGFLQTVDFAEIKRSVWDGSVLVLLWVLGVCLVKRYKSQITEEQARVSFITNWFIAFNLIFIFVIEVTNYFFITRGGLPIFVDHLRPVRAVGYVLIMQAAIFVYLWHRFFSRR
mgnify:FL=1